MPDDDKELEALFATPKKSANIEDELDALFGKSKAQAPNIEDELDALFAKKPEAPAPTNEVVELPTQVIEGNETPKRSYGESFARGAGNALTAGFDDEIAGGLLNLTAPNSANGIPITRGNDAIDQIRADKGAAFAANPKTSVAGNLAGGVLAGAAAGGAASGASAASSLLPALTAEQAGIAGALASNAAQLRASQYGGAEGNFSDRTAQVADQVREHPIADAAMLAAPAAIPAAAGAIAPTLRRTAADATRKVNESLAKIILNHAQSKKLALKGGQEAIGKFGAEMDEAGLFKPRSLMQRFKGADAKRVADNAEELLDTSGHEIGKFEDTLAQRGINPDVNVKPLADDLNSQAAEFERTASGPLRRQAEPLRAQAKDLIPDAQEAEVSTPPSLPAWYRRLAGQQREIPIENPIGPRAGKPTELPARTAAIPPESAPSPQGKINFPYDDEQTSLDLNIPEKPWTPGPGPRGQQATLDYSYENPQTDLPYGESQTALDLPATKLATPNVPPDAQPDLPFPLNPPDPASASSSDPSFAGRVRTALASGRIKPLGEDYVSAQGNPEHWLGDLYKEFPEMSRRQFAQELRKAQLTGELSLTRQDLNNFGDVSPHEFNHAGDATVHKFAVNPRAPSASALPRLGAKPMPELPVPPTQKPLDLATQRNLPGTSPMPRAPVPAPISPTPEQMSLDLATQAELPISRQQPPAFKPGPLPQIQTEMPVPPPTGGGLTSYANLPPGPEFANVPDSALHEPGTLPYDVAMRTRRGLGKSINWAKKPNGPERSLGQDASEMTTWAGLKDATIESMQAAAQRGEINPEELSTFLSAQKNYSTASKAFEPALAVAQKADGKTDTASLASALLLGGHPGTAAAAALANKSSGGALLRQAYRARSGINSGAANMLEKVSSGKIPPGALTPIASARLTLPRGTPKNEVEQKAQADVKKTLFQRLLK